MMLIKGQNEIYFIDRNNSVFEVDNLTFLRANNLQQHLEDTLVDGVGFIFDIYIYIFLIYFLF